MTYVTARMLYSFGSPLSMSPYICMHTVKVPTASTYM